jgi:transposase
LFLSSLFILQLNKNKHHKHVLEQTITLIPDDLWNEEIKNICQMKKPENTIGHLIVPYRKVLDGIIYVLRAGCRKMLPKEDGSGSTYYRRFQEWRERIRYF